MELGNGAPDRATTSGPTSSGSATACSQLLRRGSAALPMRPASACDAKLTPGGSRSAPVVDLFPAIDIRHGRVVRLSQGEATRQTVYGDDPVAVAERFADAGRALDSRRGSRPRVRRRRQPGGRPPDRGASRRAGAGPARRRPADASSACARGSTQGVTRVVIGTAAAIDPAVVPAAIAAVGADRIAVGIDARDGRVAIRGWTETSDAHAPSRSRARVVGEGVAHDHLHRHRARRHARPARISTAPADSRPRGPA